MKKSLFLFCFLIVLGMHSYAQYDLNMPIPIDPSIKIGKLPNGMTYYIKNNKEPKERANFYIIYNVGALQEESHQNGLAHFLEHMAFNGTKNFPGGNTESTSIVKTLERHGMAFGANINAYTAMDRTVYYFNDAPVKNEALIDTCLLVLHDWSNYITLDEKEIDNERGVISEEWRSRRNAAARMRPQYFPMVFGDTKYSNHDVIGSLEIINNFKPQILRDFYHDWYRTDLTAIAVVGDIDVEEMEKKIIKVFSPIPAVKNAKQKEKIVLPYNEEPQYALATDIDQTATEIDIYMIFPQERDNTLKGMRQRAINNIFNMMIAQRILDGINEGKLPIEKGSASISQMITDYMAYTVSFMGKPKKHLEGLESLYTEIVRAKRYGFTEEEFKRTKLNIQASLDKQYSQKDKISNKTIGDDIISLFVYNKPTVNPEDTYTISKFIYDQIDVTDVNAIAAHSFTFDNTKILVKAPIDGEHPTKKEILDVIAKVNNNTAIEPYIDVIIDGELIDKPLAGGKIIKEKSLPIYNTKEWILSNGAKVYYTHSTLTKNSVNINSHSEGGISVVPLKDVFAADIMSSALTGLGKFKDTELHKMLAGKKISRKVALTELSEHVSGNSTTEDFETLLQMIYLTFTEPRFDSAQFNININRLASVFDQILKPSDYKMQDSLTAILKNYHPRAKLLKSNDVRNIKLEDAERIYRDRIKDASDFKFFIVGDIEEQHVRTLVEKYIGSIPSIYRKDKYVDHKMAAPKGHTEKKILTDFGTPKSTINITFENNNVKINPKFNQTFNVLKAILDIRFTANIREKEGGTYGVRTKVDTRSLPSNRATLSIQFDTNPSKAERLKSLVYAEINDIINNGVTADELTNVTKNMLKKREQLVQKIEWVENSVTEYVLNGVDNTSSKNFEDILKNMKPTDIQRFTKDFIKKANVVDLLFANSFEN